MEAEFNVGDVVYILTPFGDQTTPYTIDEVQFFDENGEFTEEPSSGVQYILNSGLAYLGKYLTRDQQLAE